MLKLNTLDYNSDIADVTNFVHPGTPLDDEASQRGTSVYLVERRIDMLPKPLTEGVALTVFVTVYELYQCQNRNEKFGAKMN